MLHATTARLPLSQGTAYTSTASRLSCQQDCQKSSERQQTKSISGKQHTHTHEKKMMKARHHRVGYAPHGRLAWYRPKAASLKSTPGVYHTSPGHPGSWPDCSSSSGRPGSRLAELLLQPSGQTTGAARLAHRRQSLGSQRRASSACPSARRHDAGQRRQSGPAWQGRRRQRR